MKNFLSVYGKGGLWMARLLAVCTLLIFSALLLAGRGLLVGALFAGYAAALLGCWSLTNRMSSEEFDLDKAKKQLQRGPFIRFGSVILVLSGMAQISDDALFVAALGYILCIILAYGCFVASRVLLFDKKE